MPPPVRYAGPAFDLDISIAVIGEARLPSLGGTALHDVNVSRGGTAQIVLVNGAIFIQNFGEAQSDQVASGALGCQAAPPRMILAVVKNVNSFPRAIESHGFQLFDDLDGIEEVGSEATPGRADKASLDPLSGAFDFTCGVIRNGIATRGFLAGIISLSVEDAVCHNRTASGDPDGIGGIARRSNRGSATVRRLEF